MSEPEKEEHRIIQEFRKVRKEKSDVVVGIQGEAEKVGIRAGETVYVEGDQEKGEVVIRKLPPPRSRDQSRDLAE